MTTSVCHGLPSSLEPGLVELQLLRLKLTPPSSSNSPQSPNPPLFYSLPQQNTTTKDNENVTSNVLHNTGSKNDENSVWASLLSLTNTNEPSAVYIHPLAKRSESLLTDKSLEMCTESLGSETGSDTSDDFDFPSLPVILHSREISGRSRERVEVTRRRCCARGEARLPPPLPSISSSSGGFRVRPHRQGGRLVMWAVSDDSPQACFKAERENGRLRLCFADTFGEDIVR